MNEVAAVHLERARHALNAARLLLDGEEVDDSISRSYYALLHAARAALICVGEAPKTHPGVNNRFWVRFVETGRVPKARGQLLSRARQMRDKADYEAFTIYDTMAAADLLKDATAFADAAEALVRSLPDDPPETPESG